MNEEKISFSPLAKYFWRRFSFEIKENKEEKEEIFLRLFTEVEASMDLGNTLLELKNNKVPLLENLIISEQQAKEGKLAPLVLGDKFIQLYKLWASEKKLAFNLEKKVLKNHSALSLEGENLGSLNKEQKSAIEKALTKDFCLITGGPGTGKTYTLARLVAIFLKNNPDLKIALAAPTGKAANRMKEALREAYKTLPEEYKNFSIPEDAQTIHRLLDIREGVAKFDEKNPLPYDLIIIDEASMLSLELANYLLEAALNSRIILLGDPNQLAAVEPGAVLYDLVQSPKLKENIASLKETKRFAKDSEIFKLSESLNLEKFSDFEKILKEAKKIKHQIPNSDLLENLGDFFKPYFLAVKKLNPNPSEEEILNLFKVFDEFRILCANKKGNLGTEFINQYLFKKFSAGKNEFFMGLPLMVEKNDYVNEIFNGDVGIFINEKIYFPQHLKGISKLQINPNILKPSFAMTVHKSQGSEFKKVLLIMDAFREEILSRELFYTAITRTKEDLEIYAHDKALKLCERKIKRTSNLMSE